MPPRIVRRTRAEEITVTIRPYDENECQICGDKADSEMGEFWDTRTSENVYAHGGCGIDAGMELA